MPPITLPSGPTVSSPGTHGWWKGRSTDRQEPGDASSSPSARAGAGGKAGTSFTVISVELKGAAAEVTRIHLSDGSFYVLHSEVAVRSGISPGATLDSDRIALLLAESERVLARSRALKLISRAAHTRRGLAQKLSARGFSPEAVHHALARMSELGYLDDRAFAEDWVRLRLAMRKEGWKAIYRGLLRKGVARSLAAEVVSTRCTPEEEQAIARQLAAGLPPSDAIRRLTGRGFRVRAIAATLKEMEKSHGSPRRRTRRIIRRKRIGRAPLGE